MMLLCHPLLDRSQRSTVWYLGHLSRETTAAHTYVTTLDPNPIYPSESDQINFTDTTTAPTEGN